MESVGTLYIQVSPRYKAGWRLMRVSYLEGKRLQKSIPKTAWPALGFRDSMTVEEARARSTQINQQNSIQRAESRSVVKIAERVERDRLHHSTFIPAELNQAFIKWLTENVTGSEKHLEKLLMQWSTAKKMIITLQLTFEQYGDNRKRFYRYLANQEYSLDYTQKLLRMVNLYGKFCAKLLGKHYEPVASPKGHDREMINDAYRDSDSYFGPSEALTPDDLSLLKEHVKPEQHSWLALTVWFGLRPSEVDLIISDRAHKFWRVEHGAVEVLWVYQPKLTSKPRDKRWKPIPLILPEQQDAIKIIYEGGAAKPLAKTIKKYLNSHITLYGGRKGFTDLMLDRGQRLEDISQWLGHSTIEMTWQKYKDKKRVGFTKVL